MSQLRDAVIVSAVRTPTGKLLGALKDLTATELGALVVREAVARAGIEPARSMNDDGQRPAGWERSEPGPPGGANGGLDDRVAARDGQQGVRLRAEGGDAGAQGSPPATSTSPWPAAWSR